MCFSLKALATVFVVTSNADAGPGTFRDALTQAAANGSATQYVISFNITDVSEAGRTITVLSQLPALSSNMVIDGSTQPGAAFGVSQAKVALFFNSGGQANFSALTITNQSDVEIYGLYLKLTNLTKQPAAPMGINITATNNVQLGDVGKGNVIAGFFYPFIVNGDMVSESSGFIAKSNMLSIESDGLTVTDDNSPNIENVYGNITIGGTSPAEGNILAEGMQIALKNGPNLATLLVQNNISGANYNLTAAIANASFQITADHNVMGSNSVVTVADNVLCSGAQGPDIFLSSLGGTVSMVRNYVGVDRNKKQLGTTFTGIYVQFCSEVHIGDNNLSDANYIGYCYDIYGETTGNLTFTKNSLFCTTGSMVYNFDPPGKPRTQCYITNVTAASITGMATPNSDVELYYSDICNTCAPQTYFASVTADASGNWSYSGTLTGHVIANATINNSSSEFTEPLIITDGLKITNACGGLGSITGLVVYNATNFKWIDAKRNVVATTIDLPAVKAGTYKLLVDNGGCADSTDYYNVLPKFQLDSSKVVVTDPSCGDSLGSVTALNLINSDNTKITYTWTDASGKVWGNALALQNVPAGTYALVAAGADTCTQTYGPVVLTGANNTISAPTVNNVRLCTAGEAYIRVQNPVKGSSYRLYDSGTSAAPLDEQPTGVFKVNTAANRSYYISQFYYNCESLRTQVQITVGVAPNIANSFTPNGDNYNDTWTISGIDNYPDAEVQIFNRYGQKVFESRGYARPFDGTYKGKKLPVGAYYYIINLNTSCNLLSGSITIIR